MTPRQAAALQERLRGRVERRDRVGRVRRLAGFDVSVKDGRSRAAVVVMDAASLDVLDERTAEIDTPFPYVPGLLAFRELPALVRAYRKLRVKPDLAIIDGHGLAHPRRFGIACHVGVHLDLPTIGLGKSLFVGLHDEPARTRGSWTPLVHLDETIGAAVRTQDGVRVVYASIGHRVSLPTAVRWVLRTATRFRLPQPIRAADARAGA